MIATFAVKIVAMTTLTILMDSIEKLVAIKVAAMKLAVHGSLIVTFGFAKKVAANKFAEIAIVNLTRTMKGYHKMLRTESISQSDSKVGTTNQLSA